MKPPTPVIALAAAALLLAGCGGQTPSPDTATSASASTGDHHDHGGGGPDAPAQPTSVTLGAPVSLTGEDFEVTYAVTKLDTTAAADDGDKAASGDVFVVATVEVHAYSGSHPVGPDNDDYTFTLLDEQDKDYPPVTQRVGDPLDGEVSAEDTLTGTIVFEVPKAAAENGRVRLDAAGANNGDQTVIWKPE